MNRGHAQSVMLIVLAVLALVAVAGVTPHAQNNPELALKAAMDKEVVDGDLKAAIELYRRVAASGDRAVAARALVRMGQCYEKLGEAQVKEARAAYERIVREFGDQAEPAKVARARLSALTPGAPGTTVRTEVAMRRVWTGSDEPVAMSPDGRYAVLIESGNRDIALLDLASGEKRRITKDGSWARFSAASGPAAISPDGKRIAFNWRIGNTVTTRITLLDGTPVQVLPGGQDGNFMWVCGWTQDGRKLLTVSDDLKQGTSRRHIIALPDGAVRDIGPERESVKWLDPSPDGRYIAYRLGGDIFVYDTVAEQDWPLVQNPAGNNFVGWTRDGSGILFVSDRFGSTRDLYLQEVEHGRPRGDAQMVRRDVGRRYAGLWMTRDGRLYRVDYAGRTGAFTVPVDAQSGRLTGSPSPIDSNYPEAMFPGWSADGRLFYYESFTGQGQGISRTRTMFIRTEDGRQAREVTSSAPDFGWANPTLSPDGRRFMVVGAGTRSGFGLFAIDSETGETTSLAKIALDNEPVPPSQNWSRDGQAIFYVARMPVNVDGKTIALVRKDLATGAETQLSLGPHLGLTISPDGTRLAYVRRNGPTKSMILYVRDVGSGEVSELWRMSEADGVAIRTPAWTPDGRYLLVAKDLKQGSELWRVPSNGGPAERLHFFSDSTGGFVVHPSGTRMAFTQERKTYELWVLENFLPAAKAPAR
jgi:Tol biopolymer transport system component